MIRQFLFRIFTFVGFGIGSWFLLHFFALFGPFIAFAYPIWWIFFPHTTMCLVCRTRAQGEKCPLCQRPVVAKNYAPKNLRSVFLNALIFFFITITSLVGVGIESWALLRFGLAPPHKSASFSISGEGIYHVADVFPMQVQISNPEVPVNVIKADLSFDPKMLQVDHVSTSGSFASFIVDLQVDNEKGQVHIAGGLPNPGFLGVNGVFATVYFQAKAEGLTNVAFLPTSLVLANDGRGTNILKSVGANTYQIIPRNAEQQASSSATMGTQVLGAHSEALSSSMRPPLLLTEPIIIGQPQVLGVTTVRPAPEYENVFNAGPAPQHTFWSVLSTIDKTIIEFWKSIWEKVAGARGDA